MAILKATKWLSRSFSSLSSHPLRVCVVDSGPAGFYTAEKILKAHEGAEVDIIDRLPTPFRLVRFGVAPDHPEAKETDLLITPADEEELKNNRIRRIYELLSEAATSGPPHPSSGQRELHFVFFRKPDRFLDSDDRSGRVAGVRFEKAILKGNFTPQKYLLGSLDGTLGPISSNESIGSVKQIAVGTGQFEDLECGLVLKSIGYKSVPVDGLPFDHQQGIVSNVGGRVLSNASGDHPEIGEGLYVCGWLKRGPTGIIAANLYCAEETVASISEDLEKGALTSTSSLPNPGRDRLL